MPLQEFFVDLCTFCPLEKSMSSLLNALWVGCSERWNGRVVCHLLVAELGSQVIFLDSILVPGYFRGVAARMILFSPLYWVLVFGKLPVWCILFFGNVIYLHDLVTLCCCCTRMAWVCNVISRVSDHHQQNQTLRLADEDS